MLILHDDFHVKISLLTLKDLFISERCIEIKIKLKAFIKPFEAPQRSMKIKI